MWLTEAVAPSEGTRSQSLNQHSNPRQRPRPRSRLTQCECACAWICALATAVPSPSPSLSSESPLLSSLRTPQLSSRAPVLQCSPPPRLSSPLLGVLPPAECRGLRAVRRQPQPQPQSESESEFESARTRVKDVCSRSSVRAPVLPGVPAHCLCLYFSPPLPLPLSSSPLVPSLHSFIRTHLLTYTHSFIRAASTSASRRRVS